MRIRADFQYRIYILTDSGWTDRLQIEVSKWEQNWSLRDTVKRLKFARIVGQSHLLIMRSQRDYANSHVIITLRESTLADAKSSVH